MDLFTHVLVAYLVTFGLVGAQPQYLAAGALAGGLPDADALFFPIARRLPLLRHHGVTHSILGVSVIALAGALVAPYLMAGSPLVYFLVMEVGGLCHVAQDGFTNFSVPPLLPFSRKQLALDADRAVNFATLAVSVVAFYVLLGLERNRVPFGVYLLTVDLLGILFAGYFALRLAGRWAVGRKLSGLREFDRVVPTTNPLSWIVLSERTDGGRVRTSWGRYTLGRGLVDGPYRAEGPIEAPPHAGTPTSEEEALAWAYPIARRSSRMLESTYHFGEANRDARGVWTAVWYSLEFTFFGRAAAVKVEFPSDGSSAKVRSGLYRPRRRPF